MALQEPGKPPPSWLWREEYMALKTCGRWFLNSMQAMIGALRWLENKSRHLPVGIRALNTES
jgi:hypothetical protein